VPPLRVNFVAAALAVLVEYAEQLPLTVRQVFYRLVGLGRVPKSRQSYLNVAEDLTMARRAGLVDWDDIRDDGAPVHLAPGWASATDYFKALAERTTFRLAADLGQPVAVEVWAESVGMVAQLQRVAHPFGAHVVGLGGQPSVTALHDAAVRIAARPVPTVVLGIGDHDRNGLIIWDTVQADVPLLAPGADRVTFERVSVTAEQIGTGPLGLRLEVDPQRPRFERTKDDGLWLPAVEAEAIAPDVQANMLRDALNRLLDTDRLERLNARSDRTSERVRARLQRVAAEADDDEPDDDEPDPDAEG